MSIFVGRHHAQFNWGNRPESNCLLNKAERWPLIKEGMYKQPECKVILDIFSFIFPLLCTKPCSANAKVVDAIESAQNSDMLTYQGSFILEFQLPKKS